MKIKTDKEFLEELENVIDYFQKEAKARELKTIEKSALSELLEIKENATGVKPLRMKQTEYISFLRYMDEAISFSYSKIGKQIAELINYFSYTYKL